jgi:hypothetical protein
MVLLIFLVLLIALALAASRWAMTPATAATGSPDNKPDAGLARRWADARSRGRGLAGPSSTEGSCC